MDERVEENQSEVFDVSIDQQHHHLCSIINDISQDDTVTPVDYFTAACIRLDKLLSSDPSPAAHDIDDLITFISTRISSADLTNESERVIVAALNRVSYLLTVAPPVTSWSHLFGILLGFIADSRDQVRRQAHGCLHDVMQSFQKTPLLSPASEAITITFESFLQLKEGSNAQDVLYVLDSLKDCLSLMPIKFSTKILIYFKSLLTLHQSAVTKKITTALYHLCLQPTIDVSPETLVDLLCSLATSVSSDDMSGGDNLTFTARLLDIGMKKVFSLNRQTCVVKLPVVFSALTDILASEHEEPLLVAMEALKSLIHACIDESLIKYGGIDQITTSGNIIEKLCATVESLLDYRFAAVWDMSFQVIAAMFDILGEYSSYFMKSTLKSLENIQKFPNEDFHYRKQLHDCVGVAVAALGSETFLKIIPLNLEAQHPNEVNVWLFPILKQNVVGARLSFFNDYILDSIRLLKLRSAKHKQEGNIHSVRTVDGLVYSLWSLLPSFCNYPVDTAESFKDLKTELCDSLFKESDFRGLICSSLQILIQQNKRIKQVENEASEKVNISQQRAIFLYTSEVASRNLDVLRSYACEMLDTISKIYMMSPKDDAGSLQMTIREFASIAEKGVVSTLFKKTMKQLLNLIQNTGGSNSMEIDNSANETSLSFTRSKLYDLAIAVIPRLDTKEIDLLFVAVKSALKLQIQKKAYKVLSTILEHDDSFIGRRFEELVKLMHSCHSSATQHRLNCLYFLIAHVLKDKSEQMELEIVASFLTEIVLALKESNKKTRNRAHEIIVQIGHSCMENGNEKLYNFFNMVVGGLAGETPHMISASLKCIACLTYEFNDLQSYAFNVLPSTFLLLQRNNRELNKASLGFLKVLVAKSQAEGLQAHLQGMVDALLSWQSSSKNQLTAKLKQLLEMLVKKCGFDAVKEVMPEEHMKLLTNIRKIIERKARKHSEQTSRQSRWNHTKVLSDFGDEETDNGNFKKSSFKFKRAIKRLAEDSYEELVNEPLDLLDREKTRSSLRSSNSMKMKLQRDDDEPEIDAQGRIIIISDDSPSFKTDITDSDMRSGKTEKRRKTGRSRYAYTGSEYSSKKADGDLKRTGKLEPYAYWPLDRKMVSRRPDNRVVARKGMFSVVKSNAITVKGLKTKRICKYKKRCG